MKVIYAFLIIILIQEIIQKNINKLMVIILLQLFSNAPQFYPATFAVNNQRLRQIIGPNMFPSN